MGNWALLYEHGLQISFPSLQRGRVPIDVQTEPQFDKQLGVEQVDVVDLVGALVEQVDAGVLAADAVQIDFGLRTEGRLALGVRARPGFRCLRERVAALADELLSSTLQPLEQLALVHLRRHRWSR
jgi:hypothetical protein